MHPGLSRTGTSSGDVTITTHTSTGLDVIADCAFHANATKNLRSYKLRRFSRRSVEIERELKRLQWANERRTRFPKINRYVIGKVSEGSVECKSSQVFPKRSRFSSDMIRFVEEFSADNLWKYYEFPASNRNDRKSGRKFSFATFNFRPSRRLFPMQRGKRTRWQPFHFRPSKAIESDTHTCPFSPRVDRFPNKAQQPSARHPSSHST